MAYRQLSPFERGIELDAASARQDKIDVWFGEWTFIGEQELFWGALFRLLDATYDFAMPSGLTEQRQVFGARQGTYRNFTVPLNADQSRFGSLLFSGKLVGRMTSGDDPNRPEFTFSFQLQLNPTRALNHQPRRSGPPPANTPPIHPTRRIAPTRTTTEITLDGRDNVILSRRQMLLHRADHWRTYRNTYLRWVDTFLSNLVDSAFQPTTEFFVREPRFNLRSVETYFELRADDPVRLVAEMGPIFRSLGTQSSTRIYRNVLGHTDNQDHSPVHSCRLVHGITAKVYAKTTRRIRLEISHDLTSSARVSTSHVRRDLSGLVSLLDAVTAHDAEEANNLMRVLERTIPPLGRQAPPYELVRAVLDAADDPEISRSLLQIIINNAGIRCPNGDPFRPAVNALRRSGVIQRARDASPYFVLTEQYHSARRVLATYANSSEE